MPPFAVVRCSFSSQLLSPHLRWGLKRGVSGESCPGCCEHWPPRGEPPLHGPLATHTPAVVLPAWQELHTWEEELTRAALQQKNQEELLRRRERELAEREIDILQRELHIIIHQLCQEKPRVKKRKGKFRKNRLKLKDGNRISLPSGWCPGTWGKWERTEGLVWQGFCGSQGLSSET